jgi:hypothetical protein
MSHFARGQLKVSREIIFLLELQETVSLDSQGRRAQDDPFRVFQEADPPDEFRQGLGLAMPLHDAGKD